MAPPRPSGPDGLDVLRHSTAHVLAQAVQTLVSNSRYDPRSHDVRMELHGSRDSIAVGLDEHLPLRSVEPGVSFPSGAPYQFFMDRSLPAYRAELAAFTEVVAGSRPSPCTVAAALEAGWIAEACPTSLQQHRPVRMEESAHDHDLRALSPNRARARSLPLPTDPPRGEVDRGGEVGGAA